jgi:3-oxoacyl-[acyl-carrier-protein] synthase II
MIPSSTPRGQAGARRAVVTGAGAVCAAGAGCRRLRDALLRGRSLLGPLALFDPAPYACRIAARVPPDAEGPAGARGRGSGFLFRAADEALAAARLGTRGLAGPDTAVVLGTTLGGMDLLPARLAAPPGSRAAPALPYHAAADALADRLGAGDASTISGACASGLMAIGTAARSVASGERRAVLAGGFDALCEFVHAGFSSLLALDPAGLRPFDARRKGLVLGEGAAAVIVEDLDSARARGAEPLAEILGFATASDANHITGPHPQGDGLLRAIRAAWEGTGLGLDALDAVHAHGTGTPFNDRMEGIALRRFLGERATEVPLTASKGAIGHTLGAAGALETVACLWILRDGVIPPAAGFEQFDPECGIRPLTEALRKPVRVILKTAAGFGGQNAALVLGAV